MKFGTMVPRIIHIEGTIFTKPPRRKIYLSAVVPIQQVALYIAELAAVVACFDPISRGMAALSSTRMGAYRSRLRHFESENELEAFVMSELVHDTSD